MTLLTRTRVREAGLAAAGDVRPLVIDLLCPHPDRLPAGLFTGARGIEHSISQRPVVALNLAVVPRHERAGPLMPTRQRFHGASEVLCPVACPAVGDCSVDPRDLAGGEKRHRTGLDPNNDGHFRIIEGRGVGPSGEIVHGQV